MHKEPRNINSPAAVDADNAHYMGHGYFIPSTTDARKMRELFKQWNEILQKSGHVDTEHYSGFSVGKVSPRQKNRHNSDLLQAPSLLNYQLVDTYLTNYFELNKPGNRKLRRLWKLDIFLLRAFTAGIDLGILTRFFAAPVEEADVVSKAFNDRYDFTLHTALLKRNKGRSKFWIYSRTKTALAHCYAWHLSDINGELTEADVRVLRLHGIDSKVCETVINRARKLKGLEPIALKWDKKKY